MTRQFWYNVGLSVALFAAVTLLLRVIGRVPPPSLFGSATNTPPRLETILLMVPVIYVVGRLVMRVTGSDRVSGFVGLYAFALYLPLLPIFTRSIPDILAMILILTALLEILDCDVAETNALRSGLYLSIASLLNSGTLLVVILMLPVVALIVGARWRGMADFVVGALVPLVVIRATFGLFGWMPGTSPVPITEPPGDFASWTSTVIGNTGALRNLAEIHLLAVYIAFGAAAFAAITVRGALLPRRGVLTGTWLLSGLLVLALGGMIDRSTHGILIALACILLLLTANAGLSVFASAGTPGAARRWIATLGVFFLLPAIVSFVRLLFL